MLDQILSLVKIKLTLVHTQAVSSLAIFPSSQNITFDEFYARGLSALEEVEEGGADPTGNYDDDEPTDHSPWAGSDRDYSYDEVGRCCVISCNYGPSHSKPRLLLITAGR